MMAGFMDGMGWEKKRPMAAGPWGGQGGSMWDDGTYSAVRQVVVVHGVAIDSVQFEYDKKGSSVWSMKHGGDGGFRTDQISLDYPDEYLTSVSGYYGSLSSGGALIIRSLTFESNRTKYGPFGFSRGMYFCYPPSGRKIVGFYGKAGCYLDSIGFYTKQLGSSNSSSKDLTSVQTLEVSRNEVYGYSFTEGTTSNGYDIILAVRGRGDDFSILSNNYSGEAAWPPAEYIGLDTKKNNSMGVAWPPAQEYRALDPKNKMLLSFPSYTSEKEYSAPANPIITYGPWGGSGGTIFDDGMYTGVRQINLTRNTGITSIKVLYDRNGQAVWGNKNGGSGGIKTDKIVFDFPFEILTHISGYYGPTLIMGPTAVKSLTFHTTKKDYGPYGEEQGTFFDTSSMVDGLIVGFHGRHGWFIDSIGVHILEGKVPSASSPAINASKRGNKSSMPLLDYPRWSGKQIDYTREVRKEVMPVMPGLVKEPVPSGPGPWGGDGGKPWDDGVYSGIKQVYITRGEVINSIQIEYDRSGQSVWSTRHGGSGETSHRVKFDYPNEVLNCISGYYTSLGGQDDYRGLKVVKSLIFHSTRGKYGPFGEEVGTFFTSTTTEGKVVGFHGRSGLYLDSIGVHMQHWLGENKKPSSTTKSAFSKYFF